eukprot:scaffold13315_cov115-Isochrysis_galbana.AAC.12
MTALIFAKQSIVLHKSRSSGLRCAITTAERRRSASARNLALSISVTGRFISPAPTPARCRRPVSRPVYFSCTSSNARVMTETLFNSLAGEYKLRCPAFATRRVKSNAKVDAPQHVATSIEILGGTENVTEVAICARHLGSAEFLSPRK